MNELGLYASPIRVDHENFAEGITLSTLVNLRTCGYEVSEETINTILSLLLNRMSRTIPNFFRCRSEREKERDLWYTVYASYEAYMALEAYVNSYNLFRPAISKTKALTYSEAISFQKALEAQIELLTIYKTNPSHIADPKTYGSSIQDCDRLIKELNAILGVLSDLNYEEQQKIYNDTLLQKIQRILE